MNFRFLIFMFMLLTIQVFTWGQAPDVNQSKALFVYNFGKYIQWPEDMESETFVIGVMGHKDIFEELEKICEGKTIHNIPVTVRMIDDPEKVMGCKIVYLSRNQNLFFKDVLGIIGNEKILLVTEGKEMLKQGADISMIKQESRIAFEINRESINKKGLRVPNELMILAINMDRKVF